MGFGQFPHFPHPISRWNSWFAIESPAALHLHSDVRLPSPALMATPPGLTPIAMAWSATTHGMPGEKSGAEKSWKVCCSPQEGYLKIRTFVIAWNDWNGHRTRNLLRSYVVVTSAKAAMQYHRRTWQGMAKTYRLCCLEADLQGSSLDVHICRTSRTGTFAVARPCHARCLGKLHHSWPVEGCETIAVYKAFHGGSTSGWALDTAMKRAWQFLRQWRVQPTTILSAS